MLLVIRRNTRPNQTEQRGKSVNDIDSNNRRQSATAHPPYKIHWALSQRLQHTVIRAFLHALVSFYAIAMEPNVIKASVPQFRLKKNGSIKFADYLMH